ncbi:MAG: M23 family metallopeptidase [Gemmatimonadaceae bacterium]
MRTVAIFVGVLWIASSRVEGQEVMVLPSRASRGSIVRIAVDEPSIADLTGELGGEPLHFHRVSANEWHALGGVPLSASGNLVGRVIVNRSAGKSDTLAVTVVLPKPAPPGRARRRRLSVSPRFTRPLDSATEARVARENERARDIGRRSHDTPRMWSSPFLKPRPSRITARFGSGRSFNRVLASTHLGVDFAGTLGAPVRAANRGVVALVANFFLAGNVVYIDHGAGIVTGYFHLSRTLVAEGDTVARGQQIGLVGATGRVTGPHLHWSARYGALTVNPLDLITVGGW